MDNLNIDIPSHHVKQDVCTTRPAYRQGRQLKAVKVYTVNNESKYLIIANIPSVGAGPDLAKACKKFGDLDEIRPLDEYPCDEFTEVYLVKYKKTQSARFAKKHLDDKSMFGGVLHVFYAPEYESIEDTREKLQERRKIIASKLRKMNLEESLSTTTNTESSSEHRHTVCEWQHTCHGDLGESSEGPVVSSHAVSQSSNSSQYSQSNIKIFPVSKNEGDKLSVTSVIPYTPCRTYRPPVQPALTSSHTDDTGSDDVPYTSTLPPPPINLPQHLHCEKPTHARYPYARVPTANAYFPADFDSRLTSTSSAVLIQSGPECSGTNRLTNVGDLTKEWNSIYDYKTQKESVIVVADCITGNVDDSQITVQCSDAGQDQGTWAAKRKLPNIESIDSKTAVKFTKKQSPAFVDSGNIVVKPLIRDYKPKTQSVPKFVPRQVSTIVATEYRDINKAEEDLKINSLHLSNIQGPSIPEAFRTHEEKTEIDDSIQKTVQYVRAKLKPVR